MYATKKPMNADRLKIEDEDTVQVWDFELPLSRGMGFCSLVVLFLSWQSAGSHSTPRCPPRPPLASPATPVALAFAVAIIIRQ